MSLLLGANGYACNPSYLGRLDWEDCSSRPTWANSSQDPISKITRAKWTGGMTHCASQAQC
jgi:hypothetical protein